MYMVTAFETGYFNTSAHDIKSSQNSDGMSHPAHALSNQAGLRAPKFPVIWYFISVSETRAFLELELENRDLEEID